MAHFPHSRTRTPHLALHLFQRATGDRSINRSGQGFELFRRRPWSRGACWCRPWASASAWGWGSRRPSGRYSRRPTATVSAPAPRSWRPSCGGWSSTAASATSPSTSSLTTSGRLIIEFDSVGGWDSRKIRLPSSLVRSDLAQHIARHASICAAAMNLMASPLHSSTTSSGSYYFY